MNSYAGLGLRVLRFSQLRGCRFKFLAILRRIDWQMVTHVSDDTNPFISGMLRRTYWYIIGDVSKDRKSLISRILRRTYWYICRRFGG